MRCYFIGGVADGEVREIPSPASYEFVDTDPSVLYGKLHMYRCQCVPIGTPDDKEFVVIYTFIGEQ